MNNYVVCRDVYVVTSEWEDVMIIAVCDTLSMAQKLMRDHVNSIAEHTKYKFTKVKEEENGIVYTLDDGTSYDNLSIYYIEISRFPINEILYNSGVDYKVACTDLLEIPI